MFLQIVGGVAFGNAVWTLNLLATLNLLSETTDSQPALKRLAKSRGVLIKAFSSSIAIAIICGIALLVIK